MLVVANYICQIPTFVRVYEVDPVSARLKNEACVLQDEVVTGEKRECRCSTLQTDLKFSNYLPSRLRKENMCQLKIVTQKLLV